MTRILRDFIYDNDQIAGAVYGLYADENIKKDDGTLVWKKDELIDQKTTTKEKEIHFTRKDMDGKETTNFYLGKVLHKRDQVSDRLYQRSGKT